MNQPDSNFVLILAFKIVKLLNNLHIQGCLLPMRREFASPFQLLFVLNFNITCIQHMWMLFSKSTSRGLREGSSLLVEIVYMVSQNAYLMLFSISTLEKMLTLIKNRVCFLSSSSSTFQGVFKARSLTISAISIIRNVYIYGHFDYY